MIPFHSYLISRPHSVLQIHSLRMERHAPHHDRPVRPSARELAVLEPEHRVHPPRCGVLDGDVLHRLLDAPHVDVRVERARRAVPPVRGPRERVDAPAVEGPARGDELVLARVEERDLPG